MREFKYPDENTMDVYRYDGTNTKKRFIYNDNNKLIKVEFWKLNSKIYQKLFNEKEFSYNENGDISSMKENMRDDDGMPRNSWNTELYLDINLFKDRVMNYFGWSCYSAIDTGVSKEDLIKANKQNAVISNTIKVTYDYLENGRINKMSSYREVIQSNGKIIDKTTGMPTFFNYSNKLVTIKEVNSNGKIITDREYLLNERGQLKQIKELKTHYITIDEL